MRRRRASWIVLLASTSTLAGCGVFTSADEVLPLCEEPVTVQAEPLARGGRITWAPGCGLRALVIPIPPSVGYAGSHWALEQDARPILPGLRYGAEPAGTRTTVPAVSLRSGGVQTIVLYGRGGVRVASYKWTT